MGCGESHVIPSSLPNNGVNVNIKEQVDKEDGLFLVSRRKKSTAHDDDNDDDDDVVDDNDENALIENQNHSGKSGGQKGENGIDADEDFAEDFDGEFDFITEKSPTNVVAKVMSEFQPPTDPDSLVIIGRKCPRLISAAQRTRQEEERILESLRNEGLIARPLKFSQNATGFEIVEENAEKKTKFIPAVLLRDEKQGLTNDAILEKLAKAEERRKQKEAEKKARAGTAKPRASTLLRQEEDKKEELRNQQMEKWENGLRNRELQLMEKQEKLKDRHQKIKSLHFKKSFREFDPFDEE